MNVIWIDQNNNKEENKGYLKKYSKELNDFSFILTTSVQEGYNKLSKFSFKLVYIFKINKINPPTKPIIYKFKKIIILK